MSPRSLRIFVIALIITLVSGVLPLSGAARAADAAPSGGASPSFDSMTVEEQLAYQKQLLDNLIELIEAIHLAPPDRQTLMQSAIKGMLEGLNDPWAEYFTADEMTAFTDQLNGQFGGIGVRYDLKDGQILVVAPIPDTPAAEAGLRAGDIIVAADGTTLTGTQQASDLIRGEPGTTIRLTIRRNDQVFDVTLTRAIIRQSSMETSMLDGGIAYIRITEFTAGVGQQFADTLKAYENSGTLKGVVLDLRYNPGGLLTEAVTVLSQLLPQDAPFALLAQDRYNTVPILTVPRTAAPLDCGLVVLVNGSSASASEVVAGGIQDAKVGVLLGTRTYGKGLVQDVLGLPYGEGIKITTARYLTIGGRSVDRVGLEPDIVVDQPDPVQHVLATSRTLSEGIIGLDVLSLEQDLALLGRNPGKVDGVFDETTSLAVALLQSTCDITPTGRVDEDTLRVINQNLAIYDAGVNSIDVQLGAAIKQLTSTDAATSSH